jgi:valacyclovir hydrolase
MPYFINNEHRLHYRETGVGNAVFIIPGNTASSASHEGELAHFGKNGRAISMDLWGTGSSDRMEVWQNDWWMTACADLSALATHLGLQHVSVLGCSGGGWIALLLALNWPSLVRNLVIDSIQGWFPESWPERVVADRIRSWDRNATFWQHAHGEDWQKVVNADSDLIRRMKQSPVATARFMDIRCPVLFTCSMTDSLLENVAEQNIAMAKQIAGSSIYLSNKGDHPFMWSCPSDFRRVVDSFIV